MLLPAIRRGSAVLALSIDSSGGRCQVVATSTKPKAAPQPAEGRELVIVDLGRTTMMPPASLEYRAAAPVGMTRDSV